MNISRLFCKVYIIQKTKVYYEGEKMTKKLIIAEKPSVMKDIAKSLGSFQQKEGFFEREDAIVSCARGHLIEITAGDDNNTSKSWKIEDLPFIPSYFDLKIINGCNSEFQRLKKLMAREDVTSIVNACDAGREGELIFRLIYEKAQCKKTIQRMWLQSMVSSAIKKAFLKLEPGDNYHALYRAAFCRAGSDWIVGINATRAISTYLSRKFGQNDLWNVGRVQTATLAMPVERELQIRNFKPQTYYEVCGTFSVCSGEYTAKWMNLNSDVEISSEQTNDENTEADTSQKRSAIKTKEIAESIIARCKGKNPTSIDETKVPEKKSPPLLFDLTTLQREANKLFKFSAKKTLDIAQALYEKHKATTYPRTDANALPEDYVEETKEILNSFKNTQYERFAQKILEQQWLKESNKRVFNNEKISDHFAIIPTGQQPESLSDDEEKIYDLIVKRFIAVFYQDAVYEKTIRITHIENDAFSTTGKVLIEPGWLDVYSQAAQDKTILCALQSGETGHTKDISIKTCQTTPPKRYTEATLLRAMETAGREIEEKELRNAIKDMGLGRPATRAAMIEGLLSDRKSDKSEKEPYLQRKNNDLIPTDKAMRLIDSLKSLQINFLISPEMTGEWEHKLMLMEKGKFQEDEFMNGIKEITKNMLEHVRKEYQSTPDVTRIHIESACPKCQGELQLDRQRIHCTNCDFELWTHICGKKLTSQQVHTLLKGQQTDVIEGLISSKTKNKFDAAFKLNENFKVTFIFKEEEIKTLKNSCPLCRTPVNIYPQSYKCSNNECSFILWKSISGRKLSNKEVEQLIKEKKTALLSGFTSKAGKPFSAYILLGQDGKTNFEFPPRK